MRTNGTLGLSANFEPQVASPLDARSIVELRTNLTLPATWKANDNGSYTYVGMLVTVVGDTPDNNGTYRLKTADFTIDANWEKFSNGTLTHNTTLTGAGTADSPLGVVPIFAYLDIYSPTGTIHHLASTELTSDSTYVWPNVPAEGGLMQVDGAGNISFTKAIKNIETKDIVTVDTATVTVSTTASKTFVVHNYTGASPRYVQLVDGSALGQEVMIADGAYRAEMAPVAIIGSLSNDVSLTHSGQVVNMVWIGSRWSVISFGEPVPPPNTLVDQYGNVLVDQFGNTLTGEI